MAHLSAPLRKPKAQGSLRARVAQKIEEVRGGFHRVHKTGYLVTIVDCGKIGFQNGASRWAYSQEETIMTSNIETIREKMDVQPSPQDKGLICTIRVTAYDNGMVCVDDRPMTSADPTHGWLGANEVIGMILGEFYRQFLKRQKELARV